MKVVHIIGGGDVGGAKTHVLSLIKEMSKSIDVKLISLRPGVFADDARALGIDVDVVKSSNIISDINKVIKIIKNEKCDIIHSHGAKANVFQLVSKIRTGMPGVTTVHSDYRLDYMHSVFKKYTIGLINSIALRFIRNYITISRNFRDMLIKRGFKPSDIHILYNGMDFSQSKTKYTKNKLFEKHNLDLDDDNIIVGIAARLYPVKSIDTIIKAAKYVKEKNPKVKFLIGGDGEDRKKLENLTQSLDLSDTVYFLGWLDDPNELMSCVDISVLSSISESFPYSILEGAKFKKPTISTCVGGIPDLIDDGENGYLFEPGDEKNLAKLIIELSFDSEKRSKMGEAIYEKASTSFSLQTMSKTQINIYNEILNKHHSLARGDKKYDAIISGYYGFNNIGDDALLLSIINDLREFKPDINMLILSKTPKATMMEHKVDSVSRSNLIKIYRTMKKSKVFIYGGGNLLQDNTSTRSLLFYLGTVWLAKKLNLKVMFYANGIGPLNKNKNRLFTNKIMNKVDVITLRENLSYEELKHMDIIKPKILLTADAALTIKPDITSNKHNIFELAAIDLANNDAPLAGISLRKYPGAKKAEQDYIEDTLAIYTDYLADNYGITPVFIPMQYPDDISILENVASKIKCKSHIIRKKLTVDQTYELISKMDILIGMRLHSLIFAASAGVPLIGLVYDPKIEGFLSYIRQPSAGDVRSLDLESLKQITSEVWQNRSAISKELQMGTEQLEDKAKENARVAVELIKNT